MIVGQEKLCEKIDRLNMDTFPRTLLLLGEYGSGKHLLVDYISSSLGCDVEEISDKLSLEYINTISQRVVPMVYVIDSTSLTVKNENVILKFLEEPLKNSYIVLLCTNKKNLIPTILNRCVVWELDTYGVDFLKSFITNDTVDCESLLRVANTPGKIIEYQSYPIGEMIDLANKIFTNIHRANIANVLTLSRFIAFKNEKDKFDVNLFLDILTMVCRDICVMDPNFGYGAYALTSRLNNNKYLFNIDKKALFENYLLELKLLKTGGN